MWGDGGILPDFGADGIIRSDQVHDRISRVLLLEGRALSAMIEAKTTTALCIHNIVVLFNVFKKFKRSKNSLQISDLRT